MNTYGYTIYVNETQVGRFTARAQAFNDLTSNGLDYRSTDDLLSNAYLYGTAACKGITVTWSEV